MTNWIPCTEQLPDSDQTVMTYSPDRSEPVWPGYHDGEEWLDLTGWSMKGVTHWVPFPEPPTGP